VDRGQGAPGRPTETPPAAPAYRLRLVPRSPAAARAGRPVYALTGIADPAGFEENLGRGGLRLVGATRYADHHAFSASEIADAGARARALGADALAITAKDRARTPHLFDAAGIETLVFDLDVETADEESLAAAILRAIRPEAS
jgi:tetraacyldisaccharide 4'-kinase